MQPLVVVDVWVFVEKPEDEAGHVFLHLCHLIVCEGCTHTQAHQKENMKASHDAPTAKTGSTA